MSILAAALCFLTPQAPASPFGDIPQQDALQYSISLVVDLAHERLQGTVDYTFAAVEPLTTIRLDARRSDEWHVTFTDLQGKELPAAWSDDHVVVTLDKPAAKGAHVQFRAALSGHPVDGFYFQKNRYGEPMAFTDHYAVRARGWLPCEDNAADRARFRLHVVAPQADEILGYGVPAAGAAPAVPPAAPPPEGSRAVDLAADAEIAPYMLAIVIGPLARVHEGGDPRLVDHFVYRQDVERSKLGLVHDAQWLQTMEKTFGPYLFQKYTTVQCPTRWGGFEAPGNVLLAEDLFDGRDHGQGTLAHELVHMWFGDGVGYAEWRDVWLSEGFASYFGPWLQSQTGGPSLRDSLLRMRATWLSSPEGRTQSIRDGRFTDPVELLNANTYPKAAWVLHMLRGELGDERFFAALRAWYGSAAGRAATNQEFTAAVEKSSGEDLGWFFAQWLERPDCPELRAAPDGDTIAVEQVQKGEPYRCWLRLRWRDGKGEPQEKRVRLDGKAVRVPAAGEVRDLQLDPDVELLFRPVQ